MLAGGRRALLAPPLHAYTKAWIAGCTVKPSAKRALLVDRLVRGLVGAGIWVTLDVLYLLAAHDDQAGRLNLVNPGTNTCSKSGTLTFTTDRGFVSNGTTGYLDTNYNPGSGAGSPKLGLNTNSFGLYANSIVANPSGGYDCGTVDHALGISAQSLAQFIARNSDTGFRIGGVDGTPGFYVNQRVNSTTLAFYTKGAYLGSGVASTATAVANANFYICVRSGGGGAFNTTRYAAFYAGGLLTATQVATFNTLLLAYLTAIGAS